MKMKMWTLTIIFKRNDEVRGKKLYIKLLDFLKDAGILGATVWTGVDGFGKRGRSSTKLEGITVNMPVLIEIIDERSKIEPILPQIKRMVGDNGILTIQEVLAL
ncbi:hypothetical protein NTE_02881 [Candidatus Nitrososphaera evergladensis SR1]|jgi:PII-like signaling protein|uniref:Uncharacterized protein n=1 Tax=Candidatus Nitrososphaera evergladensis SR1 TaxID=1459636 RepID=A0A075N094_9ARCH|nr:DUF190 domain-containing protein [Candidatus Nitrososphaera evergladensis]AIF84919.1 hypothetical protein NTE_02881 [Candidatus Nitrososphaera evergladensis SR1]